MTTIFDDAETARFLLPVLATLGLIADAVKNPKLLETVKSAASEARAEQARAVEVRKQIAAEREAADVRIAAANQANADYTDHRERTERQLKLLDSDVRENEQRVLQLQREAEALMEAAKAKERSVADMIAKARGHLAEVA